MIKNPVWTFNWKNKNQNNILQNPSKSRDSHNNTLFVSLFKLCVHFIPNHWIVILGLISLLSWRIKTLALQRKSKFQQRQHKTMHQQFHRILYGKWNGLNTRNNLALLNWPPRSNSFWLGLCCLQQCCRNSRRHRNHTLHCCCHRHSCRLPAS